MKYIHEDDSIDLIVIKTLNTLNGPLQSNPYFTKLKIKKCLCERSGQKYKCVNNLANYPRSEFKYKIESGVLTALYKNVIFMLIENIVQVILDDKSNWTLCNFAKCKQSC